MTKKSLLFFVPVILFTAFFVLMIQALFQDESKPLPPVGQAVPSIKIPALFSDGVFSTDDFPPGSVKIVNFFASWCLPCRYEHPFLQDLSLRPNVILYGIAWKDEANKAEDFLLDLGNPFHLAGDDSLGRAGIEWGVSGVPETYIIDAGNIVRFRHRGPITPDIFETQIIPLLEKLEAGKEGEG